MIYKQTTPRPLLVLTLAGLFIVLSAISLNVTARVTTIAGLWPLLLLVAVGIVATCTIYVSISFATTRLCYVTLVLLAILFVFSLEVSDVIINRPVFQTSDRVNRLWSTFAELIACVVLFIVFCAGSRLVAGRLFGVVFSDTPPDQYCAECGYDRTTFLQVLCPECGCSCTRTSIPAISLEFLRALTRFCSVASIVLIVLYYVWMKWLA